ncbi:efflux RND transporter periplasmic adaptor subunit [Algisphaera agarilytica]|uniref:RND family efflux transporter MFP subunit n=1 Tax=Algisphaera agarilytica TaxID=1385975 RepID=A0A7X0LJ72_9BACT|nr:HlyD family efflux transporter periplasmic adaptor subunit [Algisphaera agarilytica]MBB6429000.1 RND family efflux transporter MFP subunit [Algisphaera agarilytica]
MSDHETPDHTVPETRDEPRPERQPIPRGPNRLLALTSRLVVAVLMLGAAIAIFFLMSSTKPVVQEVDPAATRQTVIVFEAQRVPVQRQWRGYGTAEALYSADVPSRVTATVESIPVEVRPGAVVTKGQLLVQLDASDFERQLDIAQQRIAELDAALSQLDVESDRLEERLVLEDSDVAIAQTEYDRQVRFQERNVGTQQDLDTAERNLITAKRNQLLTREAADLIGPRRRSLEAQKASQQSQVNLAELNQQRTTILSPIDGVLQTIDVEVGENLAAGQTIARVVSLSPIEVPIQLPASSRMSVSVGDRVILEPTSGPASLIDGLGWTTTIARIAPEQDATTRTLTVYADLTDENGNARLPAPGMFLEATVAIADVEDRFVVPRRSIRQGRIQVAQDGEVVSRAVQVAYTLSGTHSGFGLPDDQWAVIDDVLEDGDLVIVNAATRIADGTLVDPKPVNETVSKASAQQTPEEGEATP